MTPKEILDLPMQENDAEVETIGEYLIELLRTLWREEEGFSGKRPFGNSGWSHELYIALAQNKVIDSEYDEEYDEYLDYDTKLADKLIFDAIDSLYKKE